MKRKSLWQWWQKHCYLAQELKRSRPASSVPRAGGSGATRSWWWRQPSEMWWALLGLSPGVEDMCKSFFERLHVFKTRNFWKPQQHVCAVSKHTQRTEIRTRGNRGSQLLEEPPIFPPPTDVGMTWPLKPCTRATDDWSGTSQHSPGGRQPNGKLAAVPPAGHPQQ